MGTPAKTIHITDAIFTEILARLPLRSIARFKSISKTWKSTIESVYFRRLFVSLLKNSSLSWSLMGLGEELIGFHGCKTWDLPKPLSFYIPQALASYSYCLVCAFSNGLVLIEESDHTCCFVGNPVLQKWYQIPPSPDADSCPFSLVTCLDEDGFVLSFKVVRLGVRFYLSSSLKVLLYSSETGIWSSKIIHCPYEITNDRCLNLYGTIYFYNLSEPGLLAAYDCYSEMSDHFRVIPLPDHPNDDDFKGALTTSGGFLMYIRTLAQSSSKVFKAWRLNNDDSWHILWKIDLPLLIGEYVPMAMHPLDSDIVYLWSQENCHVVSCNLRTHSNRILRDAYNDQDCIFNRSLCEEYMDEICRYRMLVGLYQFVLPQWMELVPCPPQVEMIDTTSLLSYISSMREAKEWSRYRYESYDSWE